MPDITKTIVSESADPALHDRMSDIEGWSEVHAQSLAEQDGIRMTNDHWAVIRFLRKHYLDHGPVESARKLTEILEDEFGAKGGLKYLYRLFPQGPVAQGTRIAGIPQPSDSTQPSFGSVR